MRRPTLALVLMVGVAIAACKSDPTPTRPKASPAAASSPKATAAAVTVASRVLQAGTGSRTLSGTVMVDAAYIVAQGGGNVLTVEGKQVVGAGGLITNDGGSLITNDGGSIVAQGGGNIVAQGGGNIVAQGGGNLITNDGGSLITNDGGSLVASDGTTFVANGIVAQGAGNIVAQGGGNYALAAVPEPGTQLPAAGMVLSVVSLATHKYVPIGHNAQGKPVYSVYSDARGGYKLYPEAPEGENVVLVASTPGRGGNYNALTPPDAVQERNLDETSTLAANLIRTAFAGQIRGLAQDTTPPGIRQCKLTAAEIALYGALSNEWVDKLRTKAQAARTWALEEQAARQLALGVVDGLLAHLVLAETMTKPNVTRQAVAESKDLPDEPVLKATQETFDDLASATQAKLDADPKAFARGSAALARLFRYVDYYHVRYGIADPQIQHGADVGAYCVGSLLWLPDPAAPELVQDLMTAAGLLRPERAKFRILGVAAGVEYALADKLLAEDFRQHFLDLVEASAKLPHRQDLPEPTPFPPDASCAPDRASPPELVLD